MKFGKSWREKDREEQNKLKSLYNKEIEVFAWYPVKLDSGTWVWLERVHMVLPIRFDSLNGRYYNSPFIHSPSFYEIYKEQ